MPYLPIGQRGLATPRARRADPRPPSMSAPNSTNKTSTRNPLRPSLTSPTPAAATPPAKNTKTTTFYA
eukprot:7874153-Lingulodinium_polyedra.AAC.1